MRGKKYFEWLGERMAAIGLGMPSISGLEEKHFSQWQIHAIRDGWTLRHSAMHRWCDLCASNSNDY